MTARLASLVVLLVMVTSWAVPLSAHQGTPFEATVVVSTDTTTEFPQGMTFAADIPLPGEGNDIDSVQILYRIASDPTLNLDLVSPHDYTVDGDMVRVETLVDFLSGFVPVGVDLTFSWEVVLTDGTVVRTSDESARWIDSRFDWEELRSDQVTLYMYDTSDDFAKYMLAESQATIDALESTYDLDAIPALSIWVYPSYEDFAGTLQGNAREAVAGVTYPGMDTMIVIVPEGDEREFGRVVPHEVSHQVLFAATQNAYGPPPLWFDEGMATHTQIGGTDHYKQMVSNAQDDGSLFDIQSLEASFPFQPGQATLAYASSWSMIGYIEERWGPEGISRMIDAFSSGLPVDAAVPDALGITLDELNLAWKAWIETND